MPKLLLASIRLEPLLLGRSLHKKIPQVTRGACATLRERNNPHLKVSREVLPDGYSEATPLTQEVRDFIDKLLKGEKH